MQTTIRVQNGHRRQSILALAISLAIVITLVTVAETAYSVQRPTNGPIDQGYLWANTKLLLNGDIVRHRGLRDQYRQPERGYQLSVL